MILTNNYYHLMKIIIITINEVNHYGFYDGYKKEYGCIAFSI